MSNNKNESNKNNEIIKAAAQIDLRTLSKIASIIDTHRGAKHDSSYVSVHLDPFHWREAINEVNGEEVFKIDRESYEHEPHNRAHYLRSRGMHISPNSEQYQGLKEVMDYIKKDFDSSQHIHEICEEQKHELEHQHQKELHSHDAPDEKGVILFCGKKYKLRDEYRSDYEMDTIEEFYIKAVAISILAESDGNSETAKSILDKGGMAIVKNLSEESVMELLQDLQVISLEGEKPQESMISDVDRDWQIEKDQLLKQILGKDEKKEEVMER